MAEPTIYVVNHGGYDYDAAEEFSSNLIFLSRGFVALHNFSERVIAKVNTIIDSATPDDYLLLSGSNLLCVHAALHWKQKHGKVNLLHWDSIAKKYILYTL